MTEFRTPRPLASSDRLSGFDCGVEALNSWLRGYARRNERSGASRTMVSTTPDGRVAAYYSIAASSLVRDDAPPSLARAQPDPVPIILLGKLAVDREFAGAGLGASMLQHAVVQAVRAADIVGTRAILVDAIDDAVIPFYERFGFTRFPDSSRTLYLLVADARATIAAL